MPHPPYIAADREAIVRAQTGDISEGTSSSHRKMWRFWTGACFVIVLLATFGRPLLALANYAAHSELHSYILLVPLVSVYLLYLRRNQLPKDYAAEHHDRGCSGMQRYSIELGAFDDQHPGRQFILEDAMAPVCTDCLRHPACHFTERISHSCDRASLCECRAANDSQPGPPARRPPLFHALVDSIFSSVVVAAQGRRPDPTTAIALSFTEGSNL